MLVAEHIRYSFLLHNRNFFFFFFSDDHVMMFDWQREEGIKQFTPAGRVRNKKERNLHPQLPI